MGKALAHLEDNIVPFEPRHNVKSQRLNQMARELERESHLLIVVLGTLIGATLALFVGYHIHTSAIHFLLLSILPVCLAYGLRKIYIHTLIHTYL